MLGFDDKSIKKSQMLVFAISQYVVVIMLVVTSKDAVVVI